MSLFPAFPQGEPGTWPELSLYAATVLLEAEGEPELGKLAVAWVIRSRMDQQRAPIQTVILGKDQLAQGDGKPYEAFSCWNDDYVAMRVARLANPDPVITEICWRVTCAAFWKLVPDPTHGATFYLNPELTRQIRLDHKLPSWYDPKRVKLRVGHHEFLIA